MIPGFGDGPIVPGNSQSPRPNLMIGMLPGSPSDNIYSKLLKGTGEFASYDSGIFRLSGVLYWSDTEEVWLNELWQIVLEKKKLSSTGDNGDNGNNNNNNGTGSTAGDGDSTAPNNGTASGTTDDGTGANTASSSSPPTSTPANRSS